jgi:EAL domain-containing protein (putative c-di-GMP-specific phosphodiesterase class I)
MAKNLQLSSVAEGVEDQADWNLVRESGCGTAQGDYIARPMDLETFLHWCRVRLADGKVAGMVKST